MAKKTKAAAAPPRDDSKFTPLELLAVSHLGKKADDVRDLVDVGDGQPVNVQILITGGMSVGSPTSYDRLVKPSTEEVLALALMGSARAVSELEDRIAKAYRSLAADDKPALDENLRKRAIGMLEAVGRPSTVHQRGRVSGSLAYEVIARG